MQKKSSPHFTYPPNLNRLDLATLVSMYRERGIPKDAKPGEFLCCALTQKMIKQGKWWFGYYYSQEAWNQMLTNHSEGYPLTEVELNILGLLLIADNEPAKRDDVEQKSSITPRLAYIIVNDLNSYGFLSIENKKRLMITPRGEKALNGIARRLYDKKFNSKMLAINQNKTAKVGIERAAKKKDEQTDLF